MSDYLELKGLTNIGHKGISELITDNLVLFLDWAFVDKGAYYNVNIPTSGIYSVDRSRLRLAKDNSFTNGRVWESHNQNWVWESGVSVGDPISVSGVYVNGTFYPSDTTGSFAHYVDYKNGRVIFNSAIATNSIVKVEYSYKWIEVDEAKNNSFLKNVQYDHWRNDSPHFQMQGSGDYNKHPEMRMLLPSIAVEVNPINTTKPYSLGTGARYVYNHVKLHVFAQDNNTANRLADILTDQKEKNIFLFDSNVIAQNNAYPLDYRGAINSRKTYPQFISDETYRFRKIRFKDTALLNSQKINDYLYYNSIRLETETVLTKT